MFNHVSEPQGNQKPQRLDLMREKCEELGVAQKNKGSIFEKVSRELLKERYSENSIKDIFLWDEWSHKDGQDTGLEGNFSNVKPLGGGISELRIDYGPGYRVYYTERNGMIILLLAGGDKSTQDKDIAKARKLAQE